MVGRWPDGGRTVAGRWTSPRHREGAKSVYLSAKAAPRHRVVEVKVEVVVEVEVVELEVEVSFSADEDDDDDDDGDDDEDDDDDAALPPLFSIHRARS